MDIRLKPFRHPVKETTKEHLIKEILSLKDKLGHAPSKHEWIELSIYQYKCVKQLFGGLNNLKRELNLEILSKHYCEEECLEILYKILEEKDGTLIWRPDKLHTRTEIIVKCNKCGYEWTTNIRRLRKGAWCAKHAGVLSKTIEDMQEFAETKGGLCLSDEYKGVFEPLLFCCKELHEFWSKPCYILSGNWCPICASGLYERICRYHFEMLFGKQFLKIKPDWLLNSRGNKMELDGYCAELGLAFEHNGMQHIEIVSKYTPTQEKLDQRIADDKMKVELCKQNNVCLIVIPELETIVPIEDLRNFIREQCLKLGYKLPDNYNDIVLNFADMMISRDTEKLKELKMITKSKGWTLISDKYLGKSEKLELLCELGHTFHMTPTQIRRVKFCPHCKKLGGIKITKEQVDEFVCLYESGLSLSNIAEILNIWTGVVSYHIEKRGIKRTLSEAIILSKKPKYTIEEIQQIKEYRKDHTLEDTAKKYKLSPKTLRKYINVY